jgi:hypothetical protein
VFVSEQGVSKCVETQMPIALREAGTPTSGGVYGRVTNDRQKTTLKNARTDGKEDRRNKHGGDERPNPRGMRRTLSTPYRRLRSAALVSSVSHRFRSSVNCISWSSVARFRGWSCLYLSSEDLTFCSTRVNLETDRLSWMRDIVKLCSVS